MNLIIFYFKNFSIPCAWCKGKKNQQNLVSPIIEKKEELTITSLNHLNVVHTTLTLHEMPNYDIISHISCLHNLLSIMFWCFTSMTYELYKMSNNMKLGIHLSMSIKKY